MKASIIRSSLRSSAIFTAALMAIAPVAYGAPRNASSPVAAVAQSGEFVSQVGQQGLLATIFSSGNGLVDMPAGFQPIDQLKTLICPAGSNNCRIEATQAVQVRGGPGGNNRWAICTQVDGVFMTRPTCPFLGVVDQTIFDDGSFSQQAINLPAGAHTVRSFIFSDAGLQRSIFSIQYRIYQ